MSTKVDELPTNIADASTSAKGLVQLNDATNSTSTTVAATANAVKKAFDKGNHSHPYEPTLAADRKRKITISTNQPSDGDDGDIWFDVGDPGPFTISVQSGLGIGWIEGSFGDCNPKNIKGQRISAIYTTTSGSPTYTYMAAPSHRYSEIIITRLDSLETFRSIHVTGEPISFGQIELFKSADVGKNIQLNIQVAFNIPNSPDKECLL